MIVAAVPTTATTATVTQTALQTIAVPSTPAAFPTPAAVNTMPPWISSSPSSATAAGVSSTSSSGAQPCAPVTVTNTLATGDVLNVNDQGNAVGSTYNLNDTTVQRVGTALITYLATESVNLNAGTGTDTVNALTTAASVNTTINTTAGGANWLQMFPAFESSTGASATFTFATGIQGFGFFMTDAQETFPGDITVTYTSGATEVLGVAENDDTGGVAYFGFYDPSASIESVTIRWPKKMSQRSLPSRYWAALMW